jgi:hypothetical protein
MVALLLKRSADVNAVTSAGGKYNLHKGGRTALWFASSEGHRETTSLIVQLIRAKEKQAIDSLCTEMSGLTIADLHQIFVLSWYWQSRISSTQLGPT